MDRLHLQYLNQERYNISRDELIEMLESSNLVWKLTTTELEISGPTSTHTIGVTYG